LSHEFPEDDPFLPVTEDLRFDECAQAEASRSANVVAVIVGVVIGAIVGAMVARSIP